MGDVVQCEWVVQRFSGCDGGVWGLGVWCSGCVVVCGVVVVVECEWCSCEWLWCSVSEWCSGEGVVWCE